MVYNLQIKAIKSKPGQKYMLKIYLSQIAKIAFKLSTMVGKSFEIYMSQIAKIVFKFYPRCLEKV